MKQSELKSIITEAVLQTLNERDKDFDFNRGQIVGIKQKQSGRIERPDPKHYPKDFMKGYDSVFSSGWWDKFNAKLTDLLGRTGFSLTKKL